MPNVTHMKPKTTTKPQTQTSKSNNAWDRISGIEFDEYIPICLYGRSGTGKTSLWSTFPGPILVLVCSNAGNFGELKSIPLNKRREVQQIVVTNAKEIEDCIEGQKNTGKFKTVVIDHITGVQDMLLARIIGLESIPEQKSWGMATREQYGQCSLQVKGVIRKFLNLSNCNRVIVAQEVDHSKEDTAESEVLQPFIGAGLTTKLAGWLHSTVDYVCQTFLRKKQTVKESVVNGKPVKIRVKTNEIEYCLRTAPDDVYASKFRMPLGSDPLPSCIVNPTYEKIISLINGESGKSK